MANSIPKIIYNIGAGDVTVQFQFPPLGLDFEGRNFKFVQKVTEANNGSYQTSDNYTEDERNLTFKQVKQSVKVAFETFMLSCGGKGKSFKYYIHSDEADYDDLKISKRARSFRPKRSGWNSEGDYTYEIKMRMRQAL